MTMPKNVRVNTHALRRTALDSAALSVLGMLVHPLPEKGAFELTVSSGGVRVATLPVRIDEEAGTTQVDVDLAALDRRVQGRAAAAPASEAVVGPKGYLVLHVSAGAGEYVTVLTDRHARERKPLFDNRKLQAGDLFVTTLLRPGRYELAAHGVRSKGQLRVAYPGASRKSVAELDAARVNVTEKGFEPKEVRVEAGQGTVFEVAYRDASVRVTLTEPDDGPHGGEPAPRKRHWTKPGTRPKK